MEIEIAGVLGVLLALFVLWIVGVAGQAVARWRGAHTVDLLKRWAEIIVLAVQQEHPDWPGPEKRAAAVKWLIARAKGMGLLWVREEFIAAFVEAAVKTLKAGLGKYWRPLAD